MNTVIYQGKTKKGNDIIVRYPRMGDQDEMAHYINALSKEQTFIRYQGETISLEEETKYLTKLLEHIEKKQEVSLLVECNSRIIALSSIGMQDKVHQHIGLFGISVAKDYRGEGVGKLLMEQVIKESIKQLPLLKIIMLHVFANNPLAESLYTSFGFIQYGLLPKGVFYKGDYVDLKYMFKEV